MTSKTRQFLETINSNPGITTAELHRRVGVMYAHGHHNFTYATVSRMVSNRLVVRGPARQEDRRGGAMGLYAVGPNTDERALRKDVDS